MTHCELASTLWLFVSMHVKSIGSHSQIVLLQVQSLWQPLQCKRRAERHCQNGLTAMRMSHDSPMQALTMPMIVPRSAGKLRVQVARALVSQKVPAKGAIMEMITTCQ